MRARCDWCGMEVEVLASGRCLLGHPVAAPQDAAAEPVPAGASGFPSAADVTPRRGRARKPFVQTRAEDAPVVETPRSIQTAPSPGAAPRSLRGRGSGKPQIAPTPPRPAAEQPTNGSAAEAPVAPPVEDAAPPKVSMPWAPVEPDGPSGPVPSSASGGPNEPSAPAAAAALAPPPGPRDLDASRRMPVEPPSLEETVRELLHHPARPEPEAPKKRSRFSLFRGREVGEPALLAPPPRTILPPPPAPKPAVPEPEPESQPEPAVPEPAASEPSDASAASAFAPPPPFDAPAQSPSRRRPPKKEQAPPTTPDIVAEPPAAPEPDTPAEDEPASPPAVAEAPAKPSRKRPATPPAVEETPSVDVAIDPPMDASTSTGPTRRRRAAAPAGAPAPELSAAPRRQGRFTAMTPHNTVAWGLAIAATFIAGVAALVLSPSRAQDTGAPPAPRRIALASVPGYTVRPDPDAESRLRAELAAQRSVPRQLTAATVINDEGNTVALYEAIVFNSNVAPTSRELDDFITLFAQGAGITGDAFAQRPLGRRNVWSGLLPQGQAILLFRGPEVVIVITADIGATGDGIADAVLNGAGL